MAKAEISEARASKIISTAVGLGEEKNTAKTTQSVWTHYDLPNIVPGDLLHAINYMNLGVDATKGQHVDVQSMKPLFPFSAVSRRAGSVMINVRGDAEAYYSRTLRNPFTGHD